MKRLAVIGLLIALCGIAHAIGQRPTYDGFQLIDGKWLNGLAGGTNFYSVGNVTATGTTQTGANQLTPGYAMFAIDTVPANGGVALPACFAGTFVTLYNSGVNTLTVYPSIANNLATGTQDKINGAVSASIGSATGLFLSCNQNGAWTAIQSSGGGGVSSITASDGSLSIAPNTGAVLAALNVAHSNAWTAQQTFAGLKVAVRTASTVSDTITTTDYFVCPDNSAASVTETLPTVSNGLTFLIKDCGGNAASHLVSIVPSPVTVAIDGMSTYTLSSAYQSGAFTYSGSQWSVN